MGLVYRARAPDGGEVALKLLTEPDVALASALRREIRALSRVNHPGIPSILDYGNESGLPWYCMPIIEGPTLGEWCAKRRSTGLGKQVLRIFSGVSATLATLHQDGLIHGDLSVQNVLVVSPAQPVVVDFGLASLLAGPLQRELPRSWRHTGVSGQDDPAAWLSLDARTDLFLLGKMIYWAATGRDFILGRARACLEAAPRRVRPLLARLLATDPMERHSDARDVLDDLEKLGGATVYPLPKSRRRLITPPLQGHNELVGELEQECAQAASGQGRLFLLHGRSGVGKTKLLNAALDNAERQGFLTAVTSCVTPSGTPASAASDLTRAGAIVSLLESISDHLSSLGAADRRRVLRRSGRADRIIAASWPALDFAARSATASAEEIKLKGASGRAAVVAATARLILALARETPVFLALDDLQWGDELTLAVIERLVADVRFKGSRILIVGTCRLVHRSPNIERLLRSDASRTRLVEALHSQSIEALAASALGVRRVPPSLRGPLLRAAKGNPLMALEFLRGAINAEAIVSRGNRWVTDRARLTSLPSGPMSMIRQRLASLDDRTRTLLRYAASLSPKITEQGLRRCLPQEAANLDGALSAAIQSEFLEHATPEAFRFLHARLREATYFGIRPNQRRRLHEKIAKRLRGMVEADVSELARHFELAGQREESLPFLLASARQATAAFALERAERLYRHYITAASDVGSKIAACNELGEDVLRDAKGPRDSLREHQKAADLAKTIGNRRLEASSVWRMGLSEADAGNPTEAERLYVVALEMALELRDESLVAAITGNLAGVKQSLGKVEEAIALCRRSIEFFRDSGDKKALGSAQSNLALFLSGTGDLDQADRVAADARKSLLKAGDIHGLGILLVNLAVAYHRRGDVGRAARVHRRALRLNQKVGNRRFEAIGLGNLGFVMQEMGRAKEAAEFYEQSSTLQRALGNKAYVAFNTANLGSLALEQEDVATAQAEFLRALKAARNVGERCFEAHVLTQLANVYRRMKRWKLARERLNDAFEILGQTQEPRVQAMALGALGLLERDQGNLEEACRHLEEAQGVAGRHKLRRTLLHLQLELGKVRIALRGGPGDAAASVRELMREARVHPRSKLGRELARVRKDPRWRE